MKERGVGSASPVPPLRRAGWRKISLEESECRVAPATTTQIGNLVWPDARLGPARAPVHARVRTGSACRDSGGGGARPLVASAAPRGRAGLPAHRGSHGALVRLLAS